MTRRYKGWQLKELVDHIKDPEGKARKLFNSRQESDIKFFLTRTDLAHRACRIKATGDRQFKEDG